MLNTCLLLEKLLSFISLTSHYIGTSAPKMVTSLCPSSSVWFIMWTIPPHSIFLSGNACFYGGVISLVGTLQVQPSLSPLRCALPLHGLVSSSIIDAIQYSEPAFQKATPFFATGIEGRFATSESGKSFSKESSKAFRLQFAFKPASLLLRVRTCSAQLGSLTT